MYYLCIISYHSREYPRRFPVATIQKGRKKASPRQEEQKFEVIRIYFVAIEEIKPINAIGCRILCLDVGIFAFGMP